MPGIWTHERRAKAREQAHRVKPWLKSTGPKTPEGKAKVARNGYRGATRPLQRRLQREFKVDLKLILAIAAWQDMEERLEVWLDARLAAGKPITAGAMRWAGLRDLPVPPAVPADFVAWLLGLPELQRPSGP